MADVFISHAAADSPFAEFLHRHLTQDRAPCGCASK
jgi:hypothetical protein